LSKKDVDGRVKPGHDARALPDALLTMREQGGPSKVLILSLSIDACKVRP
jgi:hypothetical protein